MIKFTTTNCSSFKINHKICVGFLKNKNLLEVYFRGIKGFFELENKEDFFIISDQKELDFLEQVKKICRKNKNKKKPNVGFWK